MKRTIAIICALSALAGCEEETMDAPVEVTTDEPSDVEPEEENTTATKLEDIPSCATYFSPHADA